MKTNVGTNVLSHFTSVVFLAPAYWCESAFILVPRLCMVGCDQFLVRLLKVRERNGKSASPLTSFGFQF